MAGMKMIYGVIGLACVIGFVGMILVAYQVPQAEQGRRLLFLGMALAFAFAGRVAFVRGKGR
jgi:hypothetical protein